MNKKLRGSGRTTRMLQKAVELDRARRAVYIVAADLWHINTLKEQLKALGYPKERIGVYIKIETPEDLGNFNFRTMSLIGAHPNAVVLCDHYTIESYYGRMLQVLHAYDHVEDGV